MAVLFGHQVRADTVEPVQHRRRFQWYAAARRNLPIHTGQSWPGLAPALRYVLTNQEVGTYAESSVSSWIWVNANGFGDVNGANYTFRRTFDVTGNPASVSLSGSWGVAEQWLDHAGRLARHRNGRTKPHRRWRRQFRYLPTNFRSPAAFTLESTRSILWLRTTGARGA